MQDEINRTIVACATGHICAGISIIRVSGPLAKKIGKGLTHRSVPRPKYAACRNFIDLQGDSIDRGIVIFFQGPASFTGEDLLELHTHGSPFIVSQIIDACVALGADHALPGEFSERAFLNGKMDLVQAESIADLISAQTKAQAVAANASVQGAFSQVIHKQQEALTQARLQLEAAIDFSEQDIDTDSLGVLKKSLSML